MNPTQKKTLTAMLRDNRAKAKKGNAQEIAFVSVGKDGEVKRIYFKPTYGVKDET